MLTSTTTIPAVTNEVRLDHNSVYSEMALLAFVLKIRETLITAVFSDLNHTLITFFLCAFPTLRLCAKQKLWFIYQQNRCNKAF
ncbi:MAG: hypothetical protein ACOVOV_11330 [Dolichospermum sp.]|jgi:hypothetical protein